MFRQIESVSLPERAASALRAAIFSGKLKPGDSIVERETARQMKVGTPVVREALISLQEQGLVRRVAKIGTFVTRFNPDQLRQLHALQIELELLAFQWARQHITEATLAELNRIVAGEIEALESKNRRRFLEREYSFHQRCWQLSQNMYLLETLNRLMGPLFACVAMANGTPFQDLTARDHGELVRVLGGMQEPEFSYAARDILSRIALRWLTAINQSESANR